MNILKWKTKYATDCDSKYQSKATRKTYKHCVDKFLQHFKEAKEPKAIPTQKIKTWLLTFETLNTRKQLLCSINSFYKLSVGMPKKVTSIPYPKQPEKLPQVINRDHLLKVINNIENLKHKSILMIGYGCGLRVGEVVNLKMNCIDRHRMLIHIKNGKGAKDRIVVLSKNLLNTLEQYARQYRPQLYLFNGQKALRYTAQSCNKIVKKYIGHAYHYHQLRHSYATTLLESGTDITLIQKLLGHKKAETTQIYTLVTSKTLSKINMPI
jgi:integrase/recombinase XerD